MWIQIVKMLIGLQSFWNFSRFFIKMADIVPADKVDLTKALRNIEENLSEVLSSIQKLNEESRQAKEEITEVFGRQLSHLHGRETQLLRQV